MSKVSSKRRPPVRAPLRDLAALLNSQRPPSAVVPPNDNSPAGGGDASMQVSPVNVLDDAWSEYAELQLALIDVDPQQPRRTFHSTSIAELAETIKAQGLIQPIAVRPHPTKPARYMLISGERRVRACRSLGHATILSRLMNIDEKTARALQLIENSEKAREAVAPWEEAQFIAQLVDLYGSQTAVVEATGMPKEWVSKRMSLLEIPSPIKELVVSRELTDHESILGLKRLHSIAPEEAQRVCKLIAGQETGQRKTIYAELKIVKAQNRGLVDQDAEKLGASEIQRNLQEGLTAAIGNLGWVNVAIQSSAKGYSVDIQVPRLDQIIALTTALKGQ